MTLSIYAGQDITPALLQLLAPIAAVKIADETVNNSAVLQNDDTLFLPMAANGLYIFHGLIVYDATTTADYKFQFTVPGGASLRWSSAPYVGSGGAADVIPHAIQTDAASNVAAGQGAGTQQGMPIRGSVIMGATAGNLQWQFAQNAAEASNCVTRAGSFLAAWRAG